MRTFLTWLAIAAIAAAAYVLGAKAGRGRYREIMAAASAIWNDPKSKKARKRAVKQAKKHAKKIGF
jgi:hypothetical protein